MTGTGRLIRLILRRDRVILPLWVLLIALLPAVYVTSFEELFPTAQERLAYATISADNAGFVALYGLLHGDSLAELVAWRAGFIPVLAGLAALLTVIRHTRADEEAGRTELIGAAAIGRYAQLAAALITTVVAGTLIGAVLAAAMIGQGLPVTGSVAFGLSFTISCWAFAAVGAIAAQLTSGARTARSIAAIVLGVSFVLRVGGDISSLGTGGLSWLAWLSPLGWATRIFPYSDVDWWPAVLATLFTAAAVAAAVVLLRRRDVGSGLLPARLGPATAAAGLRSPVALAWRLHRGLLIGWTVGFALLGLVFGGIGSSVRDIAQDSPGLAEIFGRLGDADDLVDSYFAGTAGIVGIIAACYAVQATLRLREEEQTGHAEAILSTSVSRFAWAGSHLLFSLLGPAVALFAEGLVAGLAYPAGSLGGLVAGTMVQLPAVWVVAAVAVLLFGLLPRYAAAAWGAPALGLLILLVGETLQLDQWLLDVSPFTHVPRLPGGDVAVQPLVVLTVVAVALAGAGLTGLRRRHIPD